MFLIPKHSFYCSLDCVFLISFIVRMFLVHVWNSKFFLLFLACSWFNSPCSCYSFHFYSFFVPQTSFDVPNLVFSVLFPIHPIFMILYCSFFYEPKYSVLSFFDLVPKILNCICLADLLALFLFSSTIFLPIYDVKYQVVYVLSCFIMLLTMLIAQTVSTFLLRIQYLCKL